ncbi:DUF2798 domain-containing protein [Ramlibacter sp. USB13]|uniref:DUF2798 domain-containing protein n=1 Tax=Ramlibacter cellulosilyticus TaxID=2764187 RepID=A0A923MKK2_9BURK|nr:DUF2798 domain-containing protein [Ramlibacter cellulosilyticus]MBC5781322.1 DUF2798 domain-containing protein [Ramlibacter cellulosilyticus]
MRTHRLEPLLFALVLSGLMSLLVSGISTLRTLGPAPGFVGTWIAAWLTAWLFAFPAVMVVAPLARRMVQRMLARA